jgi:hypothetical protein
MILLDRSLKLFLVNLFRGINVANIFYKLSQTYESLTNMNTIATFIWKYCDSDIYFGSIHLL